ncbi:hypothetical protein [Candidatus Vallotia cooleyia]|uniref:hypothetical protein n=1 Tax=Candidatus Vallotiella adelgis TaxID=1177211 RepID=UPI001D028216|nr:hypothetical protein [Candidatus Vallotia cooleyia]
MKRRAQIERRLDNRLDRLPALNDAPSHSIIVQMRADKIHVGMPRRVQEAPRFLL